MRSREDDYLPLQGEKQTKQRGLYHTDQKPLNNVIITSALDVVCSEWYYLFVCKKGFILILFSIIILVVDSTKNYISEMSTAHSSAFSCSLEGAGCATTGILESK